MFVGEYLNCCPESVASPFHPNVHMHELKKKVAPWASDHHPRQPIYSYNSHYKQNLYALVNRHRCSSGLLFLLSHWDILIRSSLFEIGATEQSSDPRACSLLSQSLGVNDGSLHSSGCLCFSISPPPPFLVSLSCLFHSFYSLFHHMPSLLSLAS